MNWSAPETVVFRHPLLKIRRAGGVGTGHATTDLQRRHRPEALHQSRYLRSGYASQLGIDCTNSAGTFFTVVAHRRASVPPAEAWRHRGSCSGSEPGVTAHRRMSRNVTPASPTECPKVNVPRSAARKRERTPPLFNFLAADSATRATYFSICFFSAAIASKALLIPSRRPAISSCCRRISAASFWMASSGLVLASRTASAITASFMSLSSLSRLKANLRTSTGAFGTVPTHRHGGAPA